MLTAVPVRRSVFLSDRSAATSHVLTLAICCAGFFASAGTLVAETYEIHTFKKITLTQKFYCEGANFADFNKDGHVDVVSGPYWYEGPDFSIKHEIYPPEDLDPHSYSHDFLTFVGDFNGDGWPDILMIGYPGEAAIWYENPQGKPGPWPKHVAFDHVDNESPTLVDLLGNGKPVLVFTHDGRIGYAVPDVKNPDTMWTFHPISLKGSWQRYTHGLGVGDVNGDGRKDILLAEGWWEQPPSLVDDPVWNFHPVDFGHGGAQMLVLDVNGDKRPDVITSIYAHEYGLAWYEQQAGGVFVQHMIIGDKPAISPYGVSFSQMHSMALADIDGDGKMDLITGKRYWAHGPNGDPEPNAPAVLYWFRQVHAADGSVQFIPNLIDSDSGVGTQVVVGDLNHDGRPDILVGNKKGTFIFLNEVHKVSKAEWEAAQPKLVAPAH